MENLLAIHFKRVQSKPYMDVRFFSQQSAADPGINTAFFVPSTIKPATAGGRFSVGGGPANPPQAKPRSLLARLLGGDLECGDLLERGGTPSRYVRCARFAFPVLALDVVRRPRRTRSRALAVSDGDQIYMYRIVDQKFEPEWSKSARSLGRVFSIQLADLDGDGILDVIGNRYSPRRSGSTSFILTLEGRQAPVPRR